ncbi:hypothetical protein ACIBHX_46625 [Nonomuraea sp. NPDC050536]|uniref:hypothetical protein n=1 Tax=Nonomuraea sp. NPDC050536 TaxID=3364366 RepID=UPI0037CA8810
MNPSVWVRMLEVFTTAMLVAVAVMIAFSVDIGSTWRLRCASVRARWRYAARQAAIPLQVGRDNVIVYTSTKQIALALLRDVIGEEL